MCVVDVLFLKFVVLLQIDKARKMRLSMEEMKMKKILLMLVVTLCWATVSNAVVYDVQADWTLNTNPNGQWSYGNMTDVTTPSTYAVNTNNETWGPNSDVWWKSAYGEWPLIWKNINDPDASSFPGEILIQAWSHGEASTVRWTAPADGFIDMDATLLYRYSDIQSTIFHNGTELLNVTNADYTDDGTGQYIYEFSTTGLAVSANDTIDVSLIDISADYNAKIALQEMITFTVPEPATMSLLGLGALALLRKRR